MLKDLLKGNVRLVIVYWVFGVLVGIIYQVGGFFLTKYYFSLMQSPSGKALLYAYVFFPFIWFPLIYIAIWRSANKYTGWRGWAILAKLAVILGSIMLIYYAYQIFLNTTKTSLTVNDIATNTQILNRSLPVMLDAETQFTSATVDQSTLTYHYKLINQDISQLDVPKFSTLLNEQLIKTGCARADVQKIMASGMSIDYEYVDKNNQPITTVHFHQSDCNK